ncbi:MAG: sn-glycerol-3-phosphate ABC transporter ATP-binding protein UgpC [Rhizobiaceae bacterium]|nr:sn-glycerol-3-phosphate ABC transporter ATP-binding protein UgpC [Rhizobiaceae bacterium]
MAALKLEEIMKSFGSVDVIKGVDLDVADGELVVFVGPSGCGKSTLLRIVAGLEDATSGTIRIDGEACNDKAPKERGIAMVFQSYALYPHKTVYQNMAFSLKLSRLPKKDIDERIHEAARILQMEHLLQRRPHQLSGGQRQRVAIGRAIVRHPKVFLFDEPLSNLDAALRVSMRREIARLHADLGSTMIYVTHDQVEAMTLADRIVVLDGGEVKQVGTPMELYHQPANIFVAGFIGSPRMNFVGGHVDAVADGHLSVETREFGRLTVEMTGSAAASVGDRITVGVRPEDCRIGDAGEFPMTIRLVERLGDETVLEVAGASGEVLVVKVPPTRDFRPGESVGLGPRAEALHVFDASGRALARAKAPAD